TPTKAIASLSEQAFLPFEFVREPSTNPLKSLRKLPDQPPPYNHWKYMPPKATNSTAARHKNGPNGTPRLLSLGLGGGTPCSSPAFEGRGGWDGSSSNGDLRWLSTFESPVLAVQNSSSSCATSWISAGKKTNATTY